MSSRGKQPKYAIVTSIIPAATIKIVAFRHLSHNGRTSPQIFSGDSTYGSRELEIHRRGLAWATVASSLRVGGIYRSVAKKSSGLGLQRGLFLPWTEGEERSTLLARTRLGGGDQTLSRGTDARSPDGEIYAAAPCAYTNTTHRAMAIRGGGEAPTSKAVSSETDKSDSGPLWGALQGLGLGSNSDAEAKAEQAKKQAEEEKASLAKSVAHMQVHPETWFESCQVSLELLRS